MTRHPLLSSQSGSQCEPVFSLAEISNLKVRTRKLAEAARQNEGLDGNGHTRAKRPTPRLAFENSNGSQRKLSDLEEDFIYAAEFGDIPTVQRILEENPSLNVDFSDILGRTPLRLAVGNEHLEVVEQLLDRSNLANIYEALLQAISSGHEHIAESILKHPKYQGMKKEHKHFGETDHFFNNAKEDSPFSADITPLILAAERNQFEIVQLLLLRGETIKKPHHYYCNCQECSNKLEFDQLRLAKTRLNAYRGLCSGAYISLSSKDPILTAFELARELRGVAKVEKYYKTDYLALAEQLSVYVVQLLDKVRGHDELEILINKTGRDSETESYSQLARLKLAIQYNEKKFVAHSSCQQKLVSIWYSDFRALERSNWFFRIMIVSLITLAYPVMCFLYIFAPKSKIGSFLRYPCIKFIGHTVSFLAFLVMLLTSSMAENPSSKVLLSNFTTQYKYYRENYQNFSTFRLHENQLLPDDFKLRSFSPQIINVVLSVWIIGMLWQELKQVYSEGIYNYFDALYNYLDFTVLTIYITSFTLRFLTLMKVKEALKYFEDVNSWEKLKVRDDHAEEEFYWLVADRLYWDKWDPHIIAEGLFAIANVMSIARLSYIFPANELFGPMQISVAKIITDVLKFGAIFTVFFVAFFVGLHNLYWYYPKEVRGEVELVPTHNLTTKAEENFGIPHITFRTVFWSLFGRGEPEAVEVKQFDHIFTETIGYWIFGVYNVCSVIVLLNMLIAMMSRSFELIQGEADTEWKFARTKLYMEYIKEGSTLPVPFNVIPSVKTFFNIIKFLSRCCFPSEDGDVNVAHPGRVVDLEMFPMPTNNQKNSTLRPRSWDQQEQQLPGQGIKHFQEKLHTTNGFVRNDSDPNIYSEKLTYKRVMKRIVKRYIFDEQRESDANDDFDEIKQDISSFRYEMLNHISVRQMETTDNRERLDRMYLKMDTIVEQQGHILRLLGERAHAHEDVKKEANIGTDQTNGVENVLKRQDSLREMNETDFKKLKSSLHDIPEEGRESVATVADVKKELSTRNLTETMGFEDFVEADEITDTVHPHDISVNVQIAPASKYMRHVHL